MSSKCRFQSIYLGEFGRSKIGITESKRSLMGHQMKN